VSPPLFQFYEKVRVIGGTSRLSGIRGELGAILGRSISDDGRWVYAVLVYRDGISWSCDETDLEPTGEHDVRSTFYDD
jgi:hypothetical protein